MDDALDSVFSALSDGTRRSILDLLRAGPKTTGELCEEFPGLSRFGVMKHLKVLQEADLVLTRPEGRKVWNHLNVVPLRRAYERWVSPYADLWAASLVAIKRSVESKKKEDQS